MISSPNISKFYLRAQHRQEGMATLQAIAAIVSSAIAVTISLAI